MQLKKINWKIIIACAILFILVLLISIKAKAMETLLSIKKLPSQWKVSKKGIAHFKKWEGFRNKMYLDSAGLPTIGIGHLIKANESYLKTKILTDEEVLILFYQDIEQAIKVVNSKIKVPISNGLFDALVSLAFNTGTIYNFIIKLVEAGNMQALRNRWLTTAITVNNGKTIVKGLQNRRRDEITLF